MGATDSEGPAWNKFWMSLDAETESVMSGDAQSSRMPPMTPDGRSHIMSPDPAARHGPGHLERGDSVLPNDSASHHGLESPEHSAVTGAQAKQLEAAPFPFKFRAPSGRMHRVQVTAESGIA